jgi:hypothetical protein
VHPRDDRPQDGEPRQTPVGKGLDGDTFWIVAEHGERASYVRNMRAHPRVRVKCGTALALGNRHAAARRRLARAPAPALHGEAERRHRAGHENGADDDPHRSGSLDE